MLEEFSAYVDSLKPTSISCWHVGFLFAYLGCWSPHPQSLSGPLGEKVGALVGVGQGPRGGKGGGASIPPQKHVVQSMGKVLSPTSLQGF